jgi:hypothetical protein
VADQERSLPELLVAFADNTTARIRAANSRDLATTVFGHRAVTNPTANNDSVDTAGIGVKFSIGSHWTNTNFQIHFDCVDDRPGIAVWTQSSPPFDPTATIALVEAYSDAGDATTLTSANSHSDTNDATTLASAHTYSDTHDATNLATAETYADAGDAATLSSANAHSNGNDITTLAAAETYADSHDASTLATAEAYSDSHDTTTLASAHTYADAGDTTTLAAAEAYSDAKAMPTGGTAGQVLAKINSTNYNTNWITPVSGTVTSVGLSLPSIITVSGSPVTGSGTLTGALATQTANQVFAGPTTGAAADPTFRAMVTADLPTSLSQYHCRVTNSTTQAITSGAGQDLTFDTETWDTGALHSTTSATARITAVVAGKYLVCGSCAIAPNATGFRSLAIIKNGTTTYATNVCPVSSAAAATALACTALVDLAASDYVTLNAAQNSGGNLNASNQFFHAILLG